MTPDTSPLGQLLAHWDPRTVQIRTTRRILKDELLNLSFHAFEELVKELLTRLGYSDARLLGRTQWRQFTRHGGGDMEAFARLGVTGGRIILQIKQYERVVSRRFVDELSGLLARSGAQEGIIITTSRFSAVARASAREHRTTPIRLIDGEELIDLLLTHRLGVWSEERAGKDWLFVDQPYFAELRANYPNRRRSARGPTIQNNPISTPDKKPGQIEPSITTVPMLWRTHLLAGISSLWLVSVLPGGLSSATIPGAVIMACFGSLLPDLDAADSRIRHIGAFGITPFAPISTLLHRSLGHRGILHSPVMLLPMAVVSASLSPWLGMTASIALLLGYASHLIMDALTRSGIPLLPFSKARLHLLPPSLRIVTGSMTEDILMVLLALAALLLLFHFLILA